MNLLHIDSSVLEAHSVSRQLTAEVVEGWRRAHPDATVEYLDLAIDAPSHLDAHSLGAKTGPQAEPEVASRKKAVNCWYTCRSKSVFRQ